MIRSLIDRPRRDLCLRVLLVDHEMGVARRERHFGGAPQEKNLDLLARVLGVPGKTHAVAPRAKLLVAVAYRAVRCLRCVGGAARACDEHADGKEKQQPPRDCAFRRLHPSPRPPTVDCAEFTTLAASAERPYREWRIRKSDTFAIRRSCDFKTGMYSPAAPRPA